jgi:peroxiredoxin
MNNSRNPREAAIELPETLNMNAPDTTRRRHLYYIVALLGASLALNVYLGWNVKALRRTNTARTQESILAEGESVPPVQAKDLNNNPGSIVYNESGKPTVLYVFSPACQWCQRNLDNMKRLVDLRGSSHQFVGLSLVSENLQRYIESNKIGYRVLKEPTTETVERLSLVGTPQTIVISPGGKVLKSWIGAYSGEVKGQVEAYFDIKLPGLSPASNSQGDSAGACRQCIRDGLAYSVGAVVPLASDRSLRCSENGKWVETGE